ncbi:uncharacterized protein LOC124290579 isoform X2 [Haliotis rubra]|uniref:uncharacterized protein LOC124290579 isoform X2 n=1 Tax=Haliotis rubra TaxID=36100 RepID=UPI001EE59CE7|nr:uncharacterized protein LOC124290579 isoform X2 [Haliotis rubra]
MFASLLCCAGRDYIQAAPDVYTKDLHPDTITGTVSKARDGDGSDGVPETKRGVTRQNSASQEDLDRVGYPQNADKKRLSNLFDTFKSSKDVPDNEHDIKHVSCRRRNVSDSDSGSSSDGETPMDVVDSKTHSSDQMSSTSAAVLARNLSETESASDLHRDQRESPEIKVPNGETQTNNKETSEGAESASTEHSRNSMSPEKSKMTPTEAVILSKRLSGPQDQLMVSQPSSSNSPVSPVHNASHSLDHKPMIVRRTSSEKSDTSSMSSARTASPATKMRLLDMASKRALERESFDQEESGHDSPRHKPEDTPSNGVNRLRPQPSRTTSGTSSPGRHEFGEGSSVYSAVEWRSHARVGGPECTADAVEEFHKPSHNLPPNTLPITHHFMHESSHHITNDTDSREITPALASSLSEHYNSGCGVNTPSNTSNVDSNTREVTPSQHRMHDDLLSGHTDGPLVQIGQSNKLLDRQCIDSDVTVDNNGQSGFEVLKSEESPDDQANLTFDSSSIGAIAAMSIHQKQNMMDTSDGTVVDQKTREEAMVPTITSFHASPVVSQATSVVNVAIEASTPRHAQIMFEVTPHVHTEPQHRPCHPVGAGVPVPQYQHSEMQNVPDLVEPVSGMSVASVHKSADRPEQYKLSRAQNSSDFVEPVSRTSAESVPMTGFETENIKPAVELEHNRRCLFDPLVLPKSSEVGPSERTRESITASSDSGSPDYDPVVVDIGISELMLGEPNPRLAVMVCMESMGSDSSHEDGEADNGMDSRPSGMENCSGIAVSSHQSHDILSSQICSPDIDATQTDNPVVEPTQKHSPLVEITQAGSPLFEITRAGSPLVELTQEDGPLVNSTLKERRLVELTQAQCPQVESAQTDDRLVDHVSEVTDTFENKHTGFSCTNAGSDPGYHPLVDLSSTGSETQYTINLDLSDHAPTLVNSLEKRALESCNLSDISVQDGKPVSGQQHKYADSSCNTTVPVAQQHSMCAPGSEEQVPDVPATATGSIENSALFETKKDYSTHALTLTHSSNNSVANACFDSEHNSDLFDRDTISAVNSTSSHKHPDHTFYNQSDSEVNMSCLTNSYKLSDSSDPHIPSLSSDTSIFVLPSNVHAQYKCPASSSDNFTSARNWSPLMNRDSDSDDIPTHKK